ERLFAVGDALRLGVSAEQVYDLTKIDPWFVNQFERIVSFERQLQQADTLDRDTLFQAKRLGFSDSQIATLRGMTEDAVRARRNELSIRAVYGRVDTCAAEFPALTPYLYSCYESESEAGVSDRRKVIILGGGPNRIGQGIEFDYCCCHAAFA